MAKVVDDALRTVDLINPILDRLAITTIILLLGFAIGKILGKLVKRVLGEVEADKNLKTATGWDFSIENFLSSLTSYFIYFIAVIMGLDTLGVTSAVLNMVAGIVVLLILISVVLAIKDFVPNLTAGIVLKNKPEYRKGVTISMKDITGKIQEVGLLETKIKTKGKETILIPNSLFIKREIKIKN